MAPKTAEHYKEPTTMENKGEVEDFIPALSAVVLPVPR